MVKREPDRYLACCVFFWYRTNCVSVCSYPSIYIYLSICLSFYISVPVSVWSVCLSVSLSLYIYIYIDKSSSSSSWSSSVAAAAATTAAVESKLVDRTNNLNLSRRKFSNRPSHMISPLDNTHCPHRAKECKIVLVTPYWWVHVWKFTHTHTHIYIHTHWCSINIYTNRWTHTHTHR